MDSDWEAEFCRAAESHPQVRSYVKNHNLGFEVPYLVGADIRPRTPSLAGTGSTSAARTCVSGIHDQDRSIPISRSMRR